MLQQVILILTAFLAQSVSAYCYGTQYWDSWYNSWECSYNNRNGYHKSSTISYFGPAMATGQACQDKGIAVDNAGACWLDDAGDCPGGCAIDRICGSEDTCEAAGLALAIGLSIFGGICLLVCCCVCFCACKATQNREKHHVTEPLLDKPANPEAEFMAMNI